MIIPADEQVAAPRTFRSGDLAPKCNYNRGSTDIVVAGFPSFVLDLHRVVPGALKPFLMLGMLGRAVKSFSLPAL